jgi:hypothetical protein
MPNLIDLREKNSTLARIKPGLPKPVNDNLLARWDNAVKGSLYD